MASQATQVVYVLDSEEEVEVPAAKTKIITSRNRVNWTLKETFGSVQNKRLHYIFIK